MRRALSPRGTIEPAGKGHAASTPRLARGRFSPSKVKLFAAAAHAALEPPPDVCRIAQNGRNSSGKSFLEGGGWGLWKFWARGGVPRPPAVAEWAAGDGPPSLGARQPRSVRCGIGAEHQR